MRHVIIGNGVASVGAIEAIRSADRESPVTVISSEPHRVYGRPLISSLLGGRIREEDIYYRPEGFYAANNVTLLTGKTATGINTQARKVRLESGEAVPFDKLLIATGGVPFVPPVEGLDGPDVYFFTTLDDARKLDILAAKLRKIVVLGGGLIGLKAAESLHDRGIHVTVVELADRILSAAFDAEAGGIIARRLAESGISLVLGNTVTKIVRIKKRARRVVLSDGGSVPCEAVVTAIGVVPNKALAEKAGIGVNRGILTDDFMQTNVPGIFAAGDVAEAKDMLWGERRVTPIWPNAYIQGRHAGLSMAGAARPYPGGIPMNSIEFYGIPTVSMGISNPPAEGYEVLARLEPEKNCYRKLVLRNGKLVGAVLVGRIDRSGILSGLIRNGVDVELLKQEMLRDDFGFSDMQPEIRQALLAAY
ncbi:MAG: FAD-dependent oxidoreductase [Syntrophales bacterium]|nr:FAD-dependent oxidoreductase [Syntrophales bacterium]